MKRRDFIITAAAGISIVSVSIYYLLNDVEYDSALAQPRSLSLIWDAKTIHAIGDQYRANTPNESSEQPLVKLLNDAASGSGLEENITNDFATGKIVLVDGWILSITEARQCALSSLISPE